MPVVDLGPRYIAQNRKAYNVLCALVQREMKGFHVPAKTVKRR